MLKLEAGECGYPANSRGWVANTVASSQLNAELESLHDSWILLIEVFKDCKPLDMVVGPLERVEKVFEV